MTTTPQIAVYLEVGSKRVFAGAVEWPGWSFHGRDEAAALQALVDCGPRYAEVLKGQRLAFKAPKDVAALTVFERLKGNSTTDFGAPDMAPKADSAPVEAADLRRLEKIITACYAALDATVEAAVGRELSKGPRGGGRELDDIVRHLADSQAGYLSALGWKFKRNEKLARPAAIAETSAAAVEGLTASANGQIPVVGPRGGQRWSARYFVRRSAWHVIDHIIEIEKRVATDGLRQNGRNGYLR